MGLFHTKRMLLPEGELHTYSEDVVARRGVAYSEDVAAGGGFAWTVWGVDGLSGGGVAVGLDGTELATTLDISTFMSLLRKAERTK